MLLTVMFSLASSLIVRLSASLETGFSSPDRRLENWQEGTKSPRTHSEPGGWGVSPATFGWSRVCWRPPKRIYSRLKARPRWSVCCLRPDHTHDLPCARAEERTRLGEVPTTVNRLDLAAGRKQFWKKLALRTYPVSPISAPSLLLPMATITSTNTVARFPICIW